MSTGDETALAAVPEGFVPVPPTSPFNELVGPIYERIGPDGFVRAFRVETKHANLNGVVHGGMMMTFADMVMARSLTLVLKRRGVTMRIVGEFLAAPRPGDWVEGRSRVVRAGKSIAFIEADVWTGERPLLTASATFRLRKETVA